MAARPQQHKTPTPARSLCIVADDLTGACDAAVAFAGSELPVRVVLEGDLPRGNGGVWAVNTRTRDASPGEARSALAGWAATLGGVGEVFKKIDSVFRGNTFVEIVAAARLFPADLIVLAPAYPALGRRVHQGRLIVEPEGSTLALTHELRLLGWQFDLLQSGTSVEVLTAQMQAAAEHNPGAVLCDALEHADLERTVEAARSLHQRVLWIGSGGLAHALAAHHEMAGAASSRPALPAGQLVCFIGSDHPATLAQVQALKRAGHHACVVPVERGITSPEQIRGALASVDAGRIGCLLMTGGDTAQSVCQALGIRALRLEREFAPGVPFGRAEGGPYDGVPVMLKSGGFGHPELMLDALHACAAPAGAECR